jgi:hypothetical protein
MSRARRHHHTPQVYLRNFADDGLLMVYNRRAQEPPRLIHTRHVAVELDLYTVEDADGNQSDIYETGWLQWFDGQIAAILPILLEPRPQLTTAHRSLISMFLALQHMRTPYMRDTIANIVDMMLRLEIEPQTRGMSPAEIDRFVEEWDPNASDSEKAAVRQVALDPSQPVTLRTEPWIKAMLRHIPDIAEGLEGRHWRVVDAEGATFLTGDLPVVLDGDRVLAISEAPAVYWPLSPNRMLMLDAPGSSNGRSFDGSIAPAETVHYINQLTAAISARHIYWHPETDPTVGIVLPAGAHTNSVNDIAVADGERFYDVIRREGLLERDDSSPEAADARTDES